MGIIDRLRNAINRSRISKLSSRLVSRFGDKEKHENYERILEYIRRQADKGSEMHQYMLQRYEEYLNQGYDFRTAVRKARQGGILHFTQQKIREAQAEEAAAAARGAVSDVVRARRKLDRWKRQVRGHALTRTQAGQDIYYHRSSGPPSIVPEGLRIEMGQRVKNSIYEAIFYILLGIFCYLGLPFFGLPSLVWLFLAFSIVKPFNIFLPKEREIVSSYGEFKGKAEMAASSKVWLFLKAVSRFIYYSFIILQFYLITFPFFRLIAIGVAFYYYFTLPLRFKIDKPHQVIESWLRPVFGFILALLFFGTFGGIGGANPVSNSLFFITLAFFLSLPVSATTPDEELEGKVVLNVFTSKGYKRAQDALNKWVFAIFMILALFFYLWQPQARTFNMVFFTFISIWLVSLIAGWGAGPESRPGLGVIMILISLFAFSSTYTGYMGQALFGYWWPQVQSATEFIGEAFGPMWIQVQKSMEDSWLLLTSPAAYYEKMMRETQATTTKLKQGGSPLSIELSRFELFTSVPGILDPKLEPVVCAMELENKGEFNANDIKVEVWAEWIDPEEQKGTMVGEINEIECSGSGLSSPYILSTAQPGSCEWDVDTYPDEIKFCSFVFDKRWDDGIDLTETKSEEVESETIETYVHAAETVKFKLNYTYNYNVNVSIPLEIIDSNLYERLIGAREITLEELTSEYTGGPVKATLWSQRQPIRDEDRSLFVASIYNDGMGDLTNIFNFEILIPTELIDDVTMVGDTFDDDDVPEGNGCTSTSDSEYFRIVCEFDYRRRTKGKPLENGEFKRVSFFVEPKEGEITEEGRKTTLIVGKAKYKYIKTESQSLMIANSPLQ